MSKEEALAEKMVLVVFAAPVVMVLAVGVALVESVSWVLTFLVFQK